MEGKIYPSVMVRKKIVNKLTVLLSATLLALLIVPITNAMMTSLPHGWVFTTMFIVGSLFFFTSYAYSHITDF